MPTAAGLLDHLQRRAHLHLRVPDGALEPRLHQHGLLLSQQECRRCPAACVMQERKRDRFKPAQPIPSRHMLHDLFSSIYSSLWPGAPSWPLAMALSVSLELSHSPPLWHLPSLCHHRPGIPDPRKSWTVKQPKRICSRRYQPQSNPKVSSFHFFRCKQFFRQLANIQCQNWRAAEIQWPEQPRRRTREPLRRGTVSPRLPVPDHIPLPPYAGTNRLPDVDPNRQLHDCESIARMRAACELAARVLEYAGTLVKVTLKHIWSIYIHSFFIFCPIFIWKIALKNMQQSNMRVIIYLINVSAMGDDWWDWQSSSSDDHRRWCLPFSPRLRWFSEERLHVGERVHLPWNPWLAGATGREGFMSPSASYIHIYFSSVWY